MLEENKKLKEMLDLSLEKYFAEEIDGVVFTNRNKNLIDEIFKSKLEVKNVNEIRKEVYEKIEIIEEIIKKTLIVEKSKEYLKYETYALSTLNLLKKIYKNKTKEKILKKEWEIRDRMDSSNELYEEYLKENLPYSDSIGIESKKEQFNQLNKNEFIEMNKIWLNFYMTSKVSELGHNYLNKNNKEENKGYYENIKLKNLTESQLKKKEEIQKILNSSFPSEEKSILIRGILVPIKENLNKKDNLINSINISKIDNIENIDLLKIKLKEIIIEKENQLEDIEILEDVILKEPYQLKTWQQKMSSTLEEYNSKMNLLNQQNSSLIELAKQFSILEKQITIFKKSFKKELMKKAYQSENEKGTYWISKTIITLALIEEKVNFYSRLFKELEKRNLLKEKEENNQIKRNNIKEKSKELSIKLLKRIEELKNSNNTSDTTKLKEIEKIEQEILKIEPILIQKDYMGLKEELFSFKKSIIISIEKEEKTINKLLDNTKGFISKVDEKINKILQYKNYSEQKEEIEDLLSKIETTINQQETITKNIQNKNLIKEIKERKEEQYKYQLSLYKSYKELLITLNNQLKEINKTKEMFNSQLKTEKDLYLILQGFKNISETQISSLLSKKNELDNKLSKTLGNSTTYLNEKITSIKEQQFDFVLQLLVQKQTTIDTISEEIKTIKEILQTVETMEDKEELEKELENLQKKLKNEDLETLKKVSILNIPELNEEILSINKSIEELETKIYELEEDLIDKEILINQNEENKTNKLKEDLKEKVNEIKIDYKTNFLEQKFQEMLDKDEKEILSLLKEVSLNENIQTIEDIKEYLLKESNVKEKEVEIYAQIINYLIKGRETQKVTTELFSTNLEIVKYNGKKDLDRFFKGDYSEYGTIIKLDEKITLNGNEVDEFYLDCSKRRIKIITPNNEKTYLKKDILKLVDIDNPETKLSQEELEVLNIIIIIQKIATKKELLQEEKLEKWKINQTKKAELPKQKIHNNKVSSYEREQKNIKLFKLCSVIGHARITQKGNITFVAPHLRNLNEDTSIQKIFEYYKLQKTLEYNSKNQIENGDFVEETTEEAKILLSKSKAIQAEYMVLILSKYFSPNKDYFKSKNFSLEKVKDIINNLSIRDFFNQEIEIFIGDMLKEKDLEIIKQDTIELLTQATNKYGNDFEIEGLNSKDFQEKIDILKDEIKEGEKNDENQKGNAKGYDYEIKSKNESTKVSYKFREGRSFNNTNFQNTFGLSGNKVKNLVRKELDEEIIKIDRKILKSSNLIMEIERYEKDKNNYEPNLIYNGKQIDIKNKKKLLTNFNKILVKRGKENKTKDFLKKENLFTKNYFGREDLELSKGIVSEFYLHKEVSSQIAKDMDYKTDTIEKEIFKRINEILKKEIREQEKSLNYNLPTQKENRLEIVKSLMHSEENGGFLLGLGKSIELPDSKFIEDNIEDITISFVEESFQSHNSGISFSIIIKLKEEILFSIDKNNIKYKTGRLTGAPSIDLGPTNDKCLYFNEYLYIKKPSKLLKQKEEEEQNFNNKEKSKNNKSDFNM